MHNEKGHLVDANAWPVTGKTWFGVSRRNRSDINNAVAFTGGKGGKDNSPVGSFLPIHEVPDAIKVEVGGITGLYASETELFVCCSYDNKIRVYDASTMAYKREWTVKTPKNIFMDAQSKIWVAIGMNATKIERYDVNGTKQDQEINLEAGSYVGDFCIDSNNRLLIGDVGQREQVLIYTSIDNSPSLTSTFGALNGIYSGIPGQMGSQKFHQVRGIGTDNSGNIYIGNTQWYTSGPGYVLESYTSAGILNFSRNCVVFVDAAGADASSDALDIYGAAEYFTLNYNAPAGLEATLAGYTVNRYKYPDDPRLKLNACTAYIRYFNGKKFLITVAQSAGIPLCIYRFNAATDGEVAIPCVLWASGNRVYPNSPNTDWMWRDLDADGLFDIGEYASTEKVSRGGGFSTFIDSNLTLWSATGDIKKTACSGLDANNIPIYSSSFTTITKPSPFTDVRRIRYYPDVDVMYLGGKTTSYPDLTHWKPMGRVLRRYNNWNTGNRNSLYEIVGPYDANHTECETASFDVAGDYIFTAIGRGNGSTIVMGQISVFNASNGTSVGYIRPPWGGIGWNDMVECINAMKRSNGEYIIIQEEDGRNKNVIYRWCPRCK